MGGGGIIMMQRHKSLNANLMDSANYGCEAFLKAERNMLFVKQVSGRVSKGVRSTHFDETLPSTNNCIKVADVVDTLMGKSIFGSV